MAGPQDIQRFPKGLIDLLGMRATGDTPSQLGQQISGELALKDEYLFDRLVGLRTGVGAGLINATGSYGWLLATVPPGQIWYVYGMSIEVTAPAPATAATLTLGVARGAANVRNYFGPSVRLVATQGEAWGEWFQVPLVMGPGDTPVGYCSSVTGVPNITATGIIWYAPVGI